MGCQWPYSYHVYMSRWGVQKVLRKEKVKTIAPPSTRNRELAAKELRKLARFQRIMDSYSDTQTAGDIRLNCDKWRGYAEK